MALSLTPKVMRIIELALGRGSRRAVGEKDRSQSFRWQSRGLVDLRGGGGCHIFLKEPKVCSQLADSPLGEMCCLGYKAEGSCPQTISLTWHHAENPEPLLPHATTSCITSG